ncbi:MAG: OadG family protein [Clostridia bacterium]|nr:OadG family protein [Clostridia bacterium]
MTINPIMLSDVMDYSKPLEFSEAIGYGLQTALLGMLVIFAVLSVLLIVLTAFKFIFYKQPKTEKKAAPVKVEAPAPAPVAAPAPAPAEPAAADDAELVAVITAAIAAMMDAPQTSFRVVSFKRTARK